MFQAFASEFKHNTLAERFEATRLALNDIADRLFSLADTQYSLEVLLKSKAAEEEE